MMDIKQLQLNSLLEVTKAINNNQSEEDLYRIFYFICISNLRFRKFGLAVKEDEHLIVKQSKGVAASQEMLDTLLENDNFKDIRFSADHPVWQVVVPVSHNKKLLAFVLIGLKDGEEANMEDARFVKTLANILMVAIENKRLNRKELLRLATQKELEIASKVQSMLFPKSLPTSDSHNIFATYLPHKSVGGDYYDVIPLSETEFIYCIADVSGKGVPAALLMSNFQASLRVLIRQKVPIEEAVKELNYQLLSNTEGASFVTMFLGKVNMDTYQMEYINAGHNPSVLVRNGVCTELMGGTTLLGALDELPFVNKQSIMLQKGDYLFNYTDGLTEVKNNAEEEFDETGLCKFLSKEYHLSPEELHQDLIIYVDEFKEQQDYFDDLTMLSIKL